MPPGTTDPEPPPSASFTRRDINAYAPDSAFIASFRQGVATMMSREATDPTSWAYQANIHGFPTSAGGSNCSPNSSGPSQPAWATCQHGSYFFLAWHRMYLYYFERILRAASGDAAFALPFWDYEEAAQRPLPVVFRVPADAATNSLFVGERNTTPGLDMNAGDPLPESDTDASLALSRIPFLTANRPQSGSTFGGWQVPNPMHFSSGYGGLERLPHNPIHNDVGGPTGWMSDPDCAARDPIFWLHHANIDRLWQVWLNEGGGRMNPTADPNWLSTQFTFFDEGGQQVMLSGSQILDTALQLDYVYEGVPSAAMQIATAAPAATPEVAAQPAAESEMLARSAGGRVALGNAARSVTMTVSPEAHQRMAAMLLEKAEERPIILTLEQVRQEQRGVNYEVYLNLPEGTEPDPDGPYYVGHLSLFSGHEGEGPQDYDLDATEVVRGLRERGEWMSGDARISFMRSGGAIERMPEGETHISFARAMLHE
jgi:tyrosinase